MEGNVTRKAIVLRQGKGKHIVFMLKKCFFKCNYREFAT